MKIEKTFTVYAPQQRVWEFITRPEHIAPCIPGCEGAQEISPGIYKATILIKVGPIKTAFSVDIEQTHERPPEFAGYDTKGEEGSHASRIKATSTLSLRPLAAAQTEVSYASDITILGRLGKFGSGMMQKIADGIGDEFVASLKDKLDDKTAAQAATGGQAPVEKAAGKVAILWWAIGIGIGVAALLWYLL